MSKRYRDNAADDYEESHSPRWIKRSIENIQMEGFYGKSYTPSTYQELMEDKMAHMGFKKLEKKIESSGKSAKSAGAIAASIGRKKYGAGKMAQAASKGKPLKESQAKKK